MSAPSVPPGTTALTGGPLTEPMTGPLSGMRILDFSRLLPGPWATQLLGALGADVVKIEQPGIGDLSRHNHPRYRRDSVYFNTVNANKRSAAIDLSGENSTEMVAALIDWADVLVESFRPGVARKLGIDAAHARTRKPSLIHWAVGSSKGSPARNKVRRLLRS